MRPRRIRRSVSIVSPNPHYGAPYITGIRVLIEVISPAGFENFFREMTDLTAAGPPQLSDLMALAHRYGLQFGQPDWLPGLISRYGLTPPQGA